MVGRRVARLRRRWRHATRPTERQRQAGSGWVRHVERLSWVLMAVGLVASVVFGMEWRGAMAGEDARAADVRAAQVQASLGDQLGRAEDLAAGVGAAAVLDPTLDDAQAARWLSLAAPSGHSDVVVEAFLADVPASELGSVAARIAASPPFGQPPGPFHLTPATPRRSYCLLTMGTLQLPPTIARHQQDVETAIAGFAGFLHPGTDFCATDAAPLLLDTAMTATPATASLSSLLQLVGGEQAQVARRAVDGLFGPLGPFLLVSPVYETSPPAANPAARLADLAGWTLTVVDAQALVGPVLQSDPGVSLVLSYQNATGSPTLLVRAGRSTGPATLRTVAVGAGGRWLASITIPQASVLTPTEEGLIVGGGAVLVTLLLVLLVRVLAVSRAQALELVVQTTGALAHQATHDGLTGLANRARVLERVDDALARARAGQADALALLVIDLDGFKDVNDAFGHAVGDELLQAVADRLVEMVGGTTTVGRLGGDEFVLVVDGAPGGDPEQLARSVLGAVALPVRLPSVPGPLSVTASIGIASGLRAAAADLLRDADIALYEAKSSGKNRFAVFRSEMRAAVVNRFDLETELRTAMRTNQFFLVYQPTFDLEGMGVTGVEALLRWHHPTRGIVPPIEFVPVLESSGMIVEVGRWVLAEACRQVRLWHDAGYPVSVAVNVSGRQFEVGSLVHDVRNALVRTGLDPHALVVEITETVLMRDPAAIAARLRQIKQLGVRIAVDDFGTGYSSMAYLQQFPVDVLKIDRSFVTGMVESPEGAALVRALVQLGKALGLVTLAEGIEDEIQLYRLRAERCDAGQGYFYAKPLAPSDAERFIAEHTVTGPGAGGDRAAAASGPGAPQAASPTGLRR
jgi:diguanylate cyclase (GGDEF)-like protein